MKIFRQTIASMLILSMALAGTMGSAQATMITTEQYSHADAAQSVKAKLAAELARPEVMEKLQKMGISETQAYERVAALSDAEVENMSGQIDSLPAGGDILGAIVGVFIILLITDILGFTKVFPFTRSAR